MCERKRGYLPSFKGYIGWTRISPRALHVGQRDVNKNDVFAILLFAKNIVVLDISVYNYQRFYIKWHA